MFCPRCGSSQSQELKFCKSCGANLQSLRQAMGATETGREFEWKNWLADLAKAGEEIKNRKRVITPETKRYREIKNGVITSSVGGGVMICTSRMKQICEINLRDRYAIVQPGLVNVHLTQKLKGTGFHYAPDPSSQGACTIGGNVATNSGGPHTLKYGVTVNHVLGLEVVLPSGEVVILGGPCADSPGYDLTGLFVGSEGTFGICTKVWVKLTRDTEGVRTLLGIFHTVTEATEAISGIIAAAAIASVLAVVSCNSLCRNDVLTSFSRPIGSVPLHDARPEYCGHSRCILCP